ncbi:major facilitator superfamily domain-containing protein [Ditylenchus destructor]|nr:major facilitator superfamily domain-containing protein [Ditylenchus destructor]
MDSQRSSGCSVRFLILLATILVLTVVYANPTSFYFTVICMMPEDYEENSNSSIADSKWTFNFSPIQGNALMSAAAIGTLIGSIPLSFCIGKFGLRKTFAAYTLMSAASTLLLPISGRIGYLPILIIRIIQGLGPATSLVMINSVSTEWSSAEYAGTYMILLSTHFQVDFQNPRSLPFHSHYFVFFVCLWMKHEPGLSGNPGWIKAGNLTASEI